MVMVVYPSSSVSRDSLPGSAARWLARALPEDQALPSTIRLVQEGEMEIRGRWTPLTATGFYRAPPLSFDWRAQFPLLPGVWIVAEDGHASGQGWGGAKLWGLVPMGERRDPEVLITQMVRNLAELALLPAFVLADPGLTWIDDGPNSFQVQCPAGDQMAIVRFETDDEGDIVRAASPSRPYDVPGGYEAAPWHYQFGEHREFDGVRIPATAAATYEKASGAWEYLRVRTLSITSEQV